MNRLASLSIVPLVALARPDYLRNVDELAACASSPQRSPAERAYLDGTFAAVSEAGLDGGDEETFLEFGRTVCDDWSSNYPDNTREQNVLGSQATVRLSQPDEAKASVSVAAVALASQYLCPE
ncbi:DUF732 domain-containing protein [Microbacterium rhizomatis]|uniref:DUF732 domain-containing protein n=1 Tax=Microbacterium rhizomatis TaxID=1631477 RepID=A0A5J5J2S8_9MICO|nr:DUF732 domain-containing protein [Microbacterium rhizomatis]KAA9110192.1 hypothetical protein F6B43_00330 [Microbacterium rhizomatis]